MNEAAIGEIRMARDALDKALSSLTGGAFRTVAEADERTEAVRIVLNAVLMSIGKRALDRKKFLDIVTQAASNAPDSGPLAARHAVFEAEIQRVLGQRG